MFSFIKRIFDKIGIDKAIAYSSLARIINAGGGIFTIFFIAASLSSDEQGYYYTFGSILAIQIFFDLGLGGIITQYVAHEVAQLQITKDSLIEGDQKYRSRLASLIHLFVKWYAMISILFLVAVSIVGYVYFSWFGDDKNISWQIPWLLLCIASAANLFLSPLIAFIQGIGKVKYIALMRLVAQVVSLLSVWGLLLAGGKLYSPAISSLSLCLISSLFVFSASNIRIIKQLWKTSLTEVVSYKNEIFPYQWKIALSWISGYFIFQLFNPIIFAYSGSTVAGQMGMTLTALNGILALALNWTSTKIPQWSANIALHKYELLDKSFNKTLRDSTIVSILCVIIFLIGLFVLREFYTPLYVRFLPLTLTAILSSTVIFTNVINAWATYFRCHKKEPFLVQSIIVGCLSAASTIILGKLVGVEGVVIGYTLVVALVSLPFGYYIFNTRKTKYQNE